MKVNSSRQISTIEEIESNFKLKSKKNNYIKLLIYSALFILWIGSSYLPTHWNFPNSPYTPVEWWNNQLEEKYGASFLETEEYKKPFYHKKWILGLVGDGYCVLSWILASGSILTKCVIWFWLVGCPFLISIPLIWLVHKSRYLKSIINGTCDSAAALPKVLVLMLLLANLRATIFYDSAFFQYLSNFTVLGKRIALWELNDCNFAFFLVVGFLSIPRLVKRLSQKIIHLEQTGFIIGYRALGMKEGRIFLKQLFDRNSLLIYMSWISITLTEAIILEMVIGFRSLKESSQITWGRLMEKCYLETHNSSIFEACKSVLDSYKQAVVVTDWSNVFAAFNACKWWQYTPILFSLVWIVIMLIFLNKINAEGQLLLEQELR